MAIEEIFNLIQIDSNTLTAGQPTEEQLADVAQEGCKLVINLATFDPRYSLTDEEETCNSLGMSYVNIPVDWASPTVEDYQAFKVAMIKAADQKILIHCAANYRVTAFYSVYAKQFLSWSDEQGQALIAQIWETNPDWKMDDVWKDYIAAIDMVID